MLVAIAVQFALLENPDPSTNERIKLHFHSHFDITEAIAGRRGKKQTKPNTNKTK